MRRLDAAEPVRAATALAMLLTLACGGRATEPAPPATPSSQGGQAAAAPPDAAPLEPLPVHAQGMAGGGSAPADGTPPAGAASGGLRWTAPKEWIEEAPSSPMRRGQYRLPAVAGDQEDGECVVYYFGAGQGGDVEANLRRWVEQFSGPGSESPRRSETKIGALTASRVEVEGTYTPSPMMMTGGPAPQPRPGSALLGAIVAGPDANWFFKCTGPAKTLKSNRGRFDALLGSIQVSP